MTDATEEELAAAKALAQEIGRAFGTRARAGGSLGSPEWPATYFDLKVEHRGLRINVEVHGSGCNITGPLTGRPLAFSLNRPTYGLEVRVDAPDLPVPLFCHQRSEADRVRMSVADPERLRLVSRLGLAGRELFAIGTDRFYLLHQSRDLGLLRTRLDAVAELVPRSRPTRLVSETAHRIKIGKPSRTGRSGRGGHLLGGELERPTKCRNCKTPAHLLLTIDPTDAALGLESLGREPLRVIFCLDCMVFPSLTYVDYSTRHPQIVRQDPGDRHDETPPLGECDVQLVRQTSAKAAGSKLGGWPKWVQEPEVPECIGCREPMAFLVQIASTPTLSFVDDGTLYTFVCEGCRMMASLVQSR